MVLQISSVDAVFTFLVFSMYVYLTTPLTKCEKKRKFLFDLGLGLFVAENIDIALTENADTSFVEIILIVILASFHYI